MGKIFSSPVSPCPEKPLSKEEDKKAPVTLRISVFFDGTGNNKYNTDERVLHDKKHPFVLKLVTRSYENDYSNVARLHECLSDENEEFDINLKLYIEGIGTRTKGYDSILGTTLGSGSTGIINIGGKLGNGKVNAGLERLFNEIAVKVNKKNQIITLLLLDVFGFSRGAAAARTFIHFAMSAGENNIKTKLQIAGFSISQVEVYFTGLFDTVASFGFSHKDDTADLHLDAISKSDSLLHLVAKDEHRKNFPFTNIKSKGAKQIFLPGVHSDVGGSYPDYMEEKNWVLTDYKNPALYTESSFENTYLLTNLMRANEQKLKAEKQKLVNEGWYHEEELDISNNFQLIANRKNIRNTYSLIPLAIMKKYAKDKGLKFIPWIEVTYDISSEDKELNELMALITLSGDGNYNANPELMKKIRHTYFHSSARYNDVGMSPNYTDVEKTIKARDEYDG